jgi:TetR/AcrR family transcriptional regulator, transcriptional repressor for nem operon
LTAEIARHPRRTRQLFVTHLQKNFGEIDHKLPGHGTGLKQRKSMAVFALLIGALQMARIAKDTALSDQILQAGIEAANKLRQIRTGNCRLNR